MSCSPQIVNQPHANLDPKRLKIQLSKRKNTLLTYAKIVEIYNAHKERDVPSTFILRHHISKVYPISYRTLMNVLGTPIAKELREVEGLLNSL